MIWLIWLFVLKLKKSHELIDDPHLLMQIAWCSIRDVTAEVGAAVLRAAVEEELAEGHGDVGHRELSHMSKVWKVSSFTIYKSLSGKVLFFFFSFKFSCFEEK